MSEQMTCQECEREYPAGTTKCPTHGDWRMVPSSECCPSCHHQHCGYARRESSADQCGYPWKQGQSYGWCQCWVKQTVTSLTPKPKPRPKNAWEHILKAASEKD